ncbi:unnamed protein product [Blepharisma stoltei]|uniref:Uncharacterized protein n=1 Tax=Blepharisma stoltei TaxID=1481888 RepID=A0AAU9K778_9CILI|nr:unnamed protein product [Blepharisma stoltei]
MYSDEDLDQLFSQLSINKSSRTVSLKESREYDNVKVTTKVKIQSTVSQKIPNSRTETRNYETPEKKCSAKSSNYDDIPRKADGIPDYRYKAARDLPRKYDGTPDMRYGCNKPKKIQEYYSFDSD